MKKGLYFTHKYPFLAIHAKGGESMSPEREIGLHLFLIDFGG
jgi:hypothetical protein